MQYLREEGEMKRNRNVSVEYIDLKIGKWWTKLRRAVNEIDKLEAQKARLRKKYAPGGNIHGQT
jgi:hypothetical protein